MALLDDLISQGWLKTERIIQAFQEIKRTDFLPEEIRTLPSARTLTPSELKHLAELNEALSIGHGQTISQPLTVAFMLELLKPERGDKVLDVGSGSGWTSALLGHIVAGGELKSKIKNQKSKIEGKVIAIEIIPELMEFGRKNVEKYNFIKKRIVEFVCTDGSKGFEKEAPFDKILASATAREVPKAWKEQLKIGGRIVAPMGSSIWLFVKKSDREFEQTEYPGFVFVPLVKKQE